MLFKLTKNSGNSKTGRVVTVTASRETCPATCPHKGKCYPEEGRLRLWWDRMSAGNWGYSWDVFIKEFYKLPLFSIVRYGQAGDLPSKTPGSSIVSKKMVSPWIRAIKVKKAKGWLYTHKKNKKNIDVFQALNDAGMTVNISCETLGEVVKWYKLGFNTVLTSEKINPNKKAWKHKGLKIIQCPNQLNKNLTCDHCTLCLERDKEHVVLFRPNKGTTVDT